MLPDLAISFSEFQNASSRLMLVLWPARTTDRFTIRDFICAPNVAIGGLYCQSFRDTSIRPRPGIPAKSTHRNDTARNALRPESSLGGARYFGTPLTGGQ